MSAAPADLFLFMRAVHGLFYYTGKLSGKVFCRTEIEKSLKKYSRDLLSSKSTGKACVSGQNKQLSQNLIISVREYGVQKVKLTLPAMAVENLTDFIPLNVWSKLNEKNINLDYLVKKVRRNAYEPQEVFSLADGEKQIKVYLK